MNRRGFTIMELMTSMVFAGVFASIALPSLSDVRARMSLGSAAAEFVSTHNWARNVAVRYGRFTYLVMDAAAGRYWVMVDTTVARTGLDTVGVVHDVAADHLTLGSPTAVFCFDARGIASPKVPCPTTSTVISFAAGGDTTKVTVTALGKVLQ